MHSRCGGAVFEAEKLTVKDDVYHKRCFSCHRCARALDSLIVATSPDGDIYCKVTLCLIRMCIAQIKLNSVLELMAIIVLHGRFATR